MSIFNLKNKKVVIVGGSGALCSAIAKGMGDEGAEIALCDISDSKETLNKLKENNIKAKSYYIDVMSIEEIQKCKNKVLEDFERIDVLINGVGGNLKEATTSKDLNFFNIPKTAFETVIKLNLLSVVYASQIFGEAMILNKKGGSIINISSMNAFRPLTNIPGYSASKAAVSNFTQWLAIYFALEINKKIRVNAIAPGFFLTEQMKYMHFDSKGNPTERAKKALLHTPMGRYGEPEELVGACIWLASEASSFVTGTVIPIDGGFNAYSGV
jgi:NAD(P)-dependent dehydrogenase (short-subunit alcohol dehydrogenase family)